MVHWAETWAEAFDQTLQRIITLAHNGTKFGHMVDNINPGGLRPDLFGTTFRTSALSERKKQSLKYKFAKESLENSALFEKEKYNFAKEPLKYVIKSRMR